MSPNDVLNNSNVLQDLVEEIQEFKKAVLQQNRETLKNGEIHILELYGADELYRLKSGKN